ncbi:MAG: PQQ-binding-like beta-propeller repeat protein, partial [Planctomycetales bacterium]|nr:PQQ-binding-like beta-propeller repeat protein [Planctomycetales bacterium]
MKLRITNILSVMVAVAIGSGLECPAQDAADVDSGNVVNSVNVIDPAAVAGLQGGLIVQLGGQETDAAAKLSLTGRYLIHVLDPDQQVTKVAQESLRDDGCYGLAWAERVGDPTRLPYAENIVNMVVVQSYCVPASELFRVLTPGGSVVVLNDDAVAEMQFDLPGFYPARRIGSAQIIQKRWPSEMDIWSHARHGADGNAVSLDSVVGPPERIRWIAAATSEVEGMVTAGGRNFYGGILARDSFNGLRLWHRDLNKAGDNNPDAFTLPRLPGDGSRPIASDRLLFAKLKDRLVALDAATGEVKVEFSEMKSPRAILFDGSRVIAADDHSVRAFDIETGAELWQADSAEPRNVVADGKRVALIQGRIKRGEKAVAVVMDAKTGDVQWTHDDYPWLIETTRTVMANGLLVFEVSTMNDHDAGNGIHVVSADKGDAMWSKEFPPGMNHARQARAMFLGDDIWILHGGKENTDDKDNLVRSSPQVSALDPMTGEVRVTYPAGLAHCFPPVATPNYLFAGELDMTDLNSGEVIANRITKANCSRESGWIPANGLVYTTPKHCTCWP